MILTEYMCQEKEEEENLSELEIVLMHWYNESKTT